MELSKRNEYPQDLPRPSALRPTSSNWKPTIPGNGAPSIQTTGPSHFRPIGFSVIDNSSSFQSNNYDNYDHYDYPDQPPPNFGQVQQQWPLNSPLPRRPSPLSTVMMMEKQNESLHGNNNNGYFVPIHETQQPASRLASPSNIAASPITFSQFYTQNRQCNDIVDEDDEDIEYFLPSFEPQGKAASPSKQPYCFTSKLAPSPAQTAETCSIITMDTSVALPPAPPLYLRPRAASVVPRSSLVAAVTAARTFIPRPQSAPTIGGRTTPEQQQRKARVKTELCMHFEKGRPCPFGPNCTYAHGHEELQMTKLLDLHEAGMVDIETYRVKPCFTWIVCGSCPFGKRCTGIHDARVASPEAQSWLPHTETQGNTITTDINVDGLHQKRLYSTLYDNPFGDMFTLLASNGLKGDGSPTGTFDDLYNKVCGMEGAAKDKNGWSNSFNKRTRARSVHPIYKFQIALKMRGNDPEWRYNYKPQHNVCGELCMVLQKRAFRVVTNEPPNSTRRLTSSTATERSSVVEISLNAYNPETATHILVHEIAFGPDCDPSVLGVALWFNVDEDQITVCTPQQAKRFRWKKPANGAATKKVVDKNRAKVSLFESGVIESFPMIRPHDQMAYWLTTEILKHRLAVLKRERMSNLKERFEHLQRLGKQKEYLVQRFENQRKDWLRWAWPINAGRDKVDASTPNPPVEGPYLMEQDRSSRVQSVKNQDLCFEMDDPVVNKENDSDDCADKAIYGTKTQRIWEGFVATSFEHAYDSTSLAFHSMTYQSMHNKPVNKRLPIFEKLANGIPIDNCRTVPHIIKHRAFPEEDPATSAKRGNIGRLQERCWKALLFTNPSCIFDRNEWEIVRDHFENSRSKKVLSILQQ